MKRTELCPSRSYYSMGLVIGFFVLLLNNFRVFSFYAYGGTQNMSFYLLIKLVLDLLFFICLYLFWILICKNLRYKWEVINYYNIIFVFCQLFQHLPVRHRVHDVQPVLQGLLPPQLRDWEGIQGAAQSHQGINLQHFKVMIKGTASRDSENPTRAPSFTRKISNIWISRRYSSSNLAIVRSLEYIETCNTKTTTKNTHSRLKLKAKF